MKRLITILAVLSLLLVLACKKESKEVDSQMATAQKIAKMEQDIDAQQNQMNALLQKYVQQGGKDLGSVVGQNLTPDQKALLEQRLKSEQGIGYKDLISEILKKQNTIEDMKVKVQDLEKKLPAPVVVKRGETQYDIAMNYLTKDQGLDQKTAKKLILRVNLMDELVPGFKVWNFYDNGVYGTFVTQGDAAVSPYSVTRRAKQKLIDAKNSAVSERDVLAKQKTTLLEQVSDLQKKRDQLNQDVAMLQAEREDLLKKIQDVKNLSEDLKARLNSVFYRVGDRKALISAGVVKDPWYGRARITDFNEASFPDHLDLRSGDTITFTAKDAGVASIRKIKIAPGVTFKANVDYTTTISPDGQTGTVKILNKDKFRAERTMVILVN